jgi:hypothetical protein
MASLRLTKCRDHRNMCRWEGRPKKRELVQCQSVCISGSGMRSERSETVVGLRMSDILLFLHARISWSAWSCVSFRSCSGLSKYSMVFRVRCMDSQDISSPLGLSTFRHEFPNMTFLSSTSSLIRKCDGLGRFQKKVYSLGSQMSQVHITGGSCDAMRECNS